MKKLISLVKASPVVAVVAGLLIAGIASAGFLAVYTTMLGTGDVHQSVVFGNGDIDKTYTIGSSPAIAGNTYTQDYNLKNQSETTAPIKFITNQCMTGGGHCNKEKHDEQGVDTSYWSTLVLENKTHTNWENWIIPDDDMDGMLTYELVAEKFNYEFEATGLTPDEEYSLIYYADRQDRFENPGGDNPGRLIGTFTADGAGDIPATTGSKNLNTNLPHANDWNGSAAANYCGNAEGDEYDLCRGAKVWLVPLANYVAGEVVGWEDSDDFLFETDLIAYSDTDVDSDTLYLGTGMLNFFVKNVLHVALAPGEYKVKTAVKPVL